MIARRKFLFGTAALALASPAFAQVTGEQALWKSVGTGQVSGGTKARTLQQRSGDFINVRDYGAVGDGSTDDTAAIQAAFNDIKIQSVGSGTVVTLPSAPQGHVYFPAGTYKVASNINMNNLGSVAVTGDGPGSAIIGSFGPTTADTTSTFNIASSLVNWTAAGAAPANGRLIGIVSTTGTLPTPLAVGNLYYIVSSSGTTCKLSNTSGGAALTLGGSQSGTTVLVDMLSGFIFGATTQNNNGNGPAIFRDLNIQNGATSRFSGCILTVTPTQVDTCQLGGFNCLDFVVGTGNANGQGSPATATACSVRNTEFRCSAAATVVGSWGVCIGNAQSVFDCDLESFDNAIRHNSTGGNIASTRIEVSHVGVALGIDDFGTSVQSTGLNILDGSYEANDIGILNIGGASSCTVSGTAMLGEAGAPNGNSQKGIDWVSGNFNTCISCAMNGQNSAWTIGGFNSAANGNNVYISCTSTGANPWVVATGNVFINSNNPSSTITSTFANLPGSGVRYIGQTAIITDCTTTTVGAVAAGGGANTVPVQWWGANWRVLASGV